MSSLSLDGAWFGSGRRAAGGEKRIGSENSLEEHQIEPALEFPADLAEMRDLFEAELGVKLQARRIGGVDAGHHRVIAPGARKLDERPQDRGADAAAASLRSDIDRVLDRVEIGGPGAKRTVASEPGHRVPFQPDQHRKVLRALGLEPLPLRLRAARLVIVGRGGVDHGVVVDRQDGVEIAGLGFAHLDHRCCPARVPAGGLSSGRELVSRSRSRTAASSIKAAWSAAGPVATVALRAWSPSPYRMIRGPWSGA